MHSCLILLLLAILTLFSNSVSAQVIRSTIPDYVRDHRPDWIDRVAPARPVPPITEWFPLGVYGGMDGPQTLLFMLDDAKQHHCNTFYLNGGNADMDEVISLAEKADLRIYWQDQAKMMYYRQRAKAPEEELASSMADARNRVPRFRDRWGLLCWGITEEITAADVPYVVRYHDLMKELDPSHPSLVTHCYLDVAQKEYEARKPEVVIFDLYPFHFETAGTGPGNSQASIAFFRTRLESYASLARASGVPFWAVVQAFGEVPRWNDADKPPYSGGYPMPTPPQIQVQAWLSISHGAKGLFYFLYNYRDDTRLLGLRTATWREHPNWKTIGVLFGRLKPLLPLMLKWERTDETVAVATDSAISLSGFSEGNRNYVVAVNLNLSETVETFIQPQDRSLSVFDVATGKEVKEKWPFFGGDGNVFLVGTQADMEEHDAAFPR